MKMSRNGIAVARELLEAFPAFVFFFVAFHMIAVTRTVVLAEYEISWTDFSVATVGALIVAGAILLVDKTFVSDLLSRIILWKSLVFSSVAPVFRVVEEFIHAIGRAGSVARAAAHLAGSLSWAYFLVLQMWVFALLFLYCLVLRLIRIIGPGKNKAMLLGRPDGDAAAGQARDPSGVIAQGGGGGVQIENQPHAQYWTGPSSRGSRLLGESL